MSLDIGIDAEVPTLQNSMIHANRAELHIPHDFEFSRNHWAVKDVDLYRFLLRNVRPRRLGAGTHAACCGRQVAGRYLWRPPSALGL